MAPLAERSLEDAVDRFEAACDGRIIYIGLEWKATLIGAVKEIETATIKHRSNVEDYKISQNLVDEFIKAYKIYNLKFQAGLTSKIDLIQQINRLNETKRTSLIHRSKYWKSFLFLTEGLGINWLD